ncbi:MAG: CPBP family intramembrane metalloprotease [Clostridia bacterium]|nr:CPBP family intramembrane metalloprotease [Clostridia bacterium]
MKRKTRIMAMMIIVGVCCGIMAAVDGIWMPHYGVKSAIKMMLFLAIPLLYSLADQELQIKELFKINKRGLKTALFLCIPLYILILGAYLLLKDVFDFSGITASLTGNIGVDRDNFVAVALYISFVNSLLEEFFFRGFAFFGLKKAASDKVAYLFSAAAFALYHVAMMTGWFSIGVFLLTLVGLFAGGLIFHYLNAKSENIYTSWFVHMFANFAINTIGFMLFGII